MTTFNFDARLNDWPEAAGAKPSQANINAAGKLLKRQHTAKHMALAMYLRGTGATQPEVIQATGDTQINVVRETVAAKLASTVDVGKARGGHKVYRVALTAPKATKARKAAHKAPADQPATDQLVNADPAQ